MSRSYHQKLKIIYIMQMLLEWTDEHHTLTTQALIEGLSAYGIKAERKSIYDDIHALQDYGMDILTASGKNGGYYLLQRDFELPELKLLVDAVQSSKFITIKKSRELIRKLEKLVSRYEATQLNRQVVVTNRNKAVNENIYYNVDMIYNGIAQNVKIRFQYFEWTVTKEVRLRKNGKYYEVSPWVLTWDDENYYLIAYDEEAGMIKHYRVDKMLKISLSVEKRTGEEQFADFDIAGYSRRTFGMFAGEEETVTLICENQLIGVVIDRFGQEAGIRPEDETHFRARLHVALSPQFYGWLCGLGAQVRIVEPIEVAEAYQDYLKRILENYEMEKSGAP